jgi:hypothetical protein
MSTEIVAGLIGAAATALLAILNSYLTSRTQVAEEVRQARIACYPQLWRLTSLVSVWPRSDPTLEDLHGLHRALRRWYYEVGGLYLSENARDRYGEVQELLAGVVAHLRSWQPETTAGRLPGTTYKDLQDTCSALRSALTEDLETRAQRSVLRSIGLLWRHWGQGRRAKKRIARASRPEEPERLELEEWQRAGIPGRQSLGAEPHGSERALVTKRRRFWLGH